MYVCEICGTCSEPREPMRKHVVFRKDKRWGPLIGTIMREIPVCVGCYKYLTTDGTLPMLMHRIKKQRLRIYPTPVVPNSKPSNTRVPRQT
jgi:hypothetical protein